MGTLFNTQLEKSTLPEQLETDVQELLSQPDARVYVEFWMSCYKEDDIHVSTVGMDIDMVDRECDRFDTNRYHPDAYGRYFLDPMGVTTISSDWKAARIEIFPHVEDGKYVFHSYPEPEESPVDVRYPPEVLNDFMSETQANDHNETYFCDVCGHDYDADDPWPFH